MKRDSESSGQCDGDDESEHEIEIMGLISKNKISTIEIRTHESPLKNVCLLVFTLALSLLLVTLGRGKDTTYPRKESDLDNDIEHDDEINIVWDEYNGFDSSEARRISILGERNSGVGWLKKKMSECFPDFDVTASLTRPAHLFQSEELHDGSTPTIVIHLTLNPYDWVEIMRKYPRYMPDHMNMKWKEFVNTPWETQRPHRDVEYLERHDVFEKNCQFRFDYNEIVPCLDDKATYKAGNMLPLLRPMYELSADSGEAYGTILDFRAAKLRNHKRVRNWQNVTFFSVNYEEFSEEAGFKNFVLLMRARTGLDIGCNSTENSYLAPVLREEKLDRKYVQWLNSNVKWKTENTVGYDEMTYDEINDIL